MVKSLIQIFSRDLDQLAKEIKAYKKEADLWLLQDGISNTGGNLCLHLAGNLQYFIGRKLGGTDYVRDREAEFSSKNIPTTNLLEEIEVTKQVIKETLDSLSKEQLEATYPLEVFGKTMTTTFFLLHLSSHLSYHLGQVNYHRRLLSK